MVKPRINQQILSKRLERVESCTERLTPSVIDNLTARLQKLEERVLMNKTMLTSAEAAEYVGISRSQLYKLTYSNKIPHYKPRGKMVYFDRNELDEWMKSDALNSCQQTTINSDEYVEKREE